MPKTKIDLTQRIFDQNDNPVQRNQETVQSVLQRISRMNVGVYKDTNAFINDLIRNFSVKEGIVKDYLKDVALLRTEKEADINDFDLYLDIRNADKEIELDDESIKKLQSKVKKSSLNDIIIGQIYYILKGLENPLNKTNKE